MPLDQTPHAPLSTAELAHSFEEDIREADLSVFAPEDWFVLAIFWLMAFAVFLQFFTRYVLNNSFAWTEEIAIYCLVATTFVGAILCTRLSRHIQVDILYRVLPARPARVLATLVDLIQIAFFAYLAVLVWRYSSLISNERMVTIDLPKSIVFYTVVAAFVLMTARAVQTAYGNWRRGYSVLERPAEFDGTVEEA